jgi:hypothetical protein
MEMEMPEKESNDLDPERLAKLGDAVCAVFNDDGGASNGEVLRVCINIIAAVIRRIDCPGCRKATSKKVKRAFAETLARASREAAMQAAGSNHVH